MREEEAERPNMSADLSPVSEAKSTQFQADMSKYYAKGANQGISFISDRSPICSERNKSF